jgi:hypothetical protein
LLPGRPDDLEALRFGPLGLRGKDGEDGDAFDLEVGLSPNDIAGIGARVEEVGIEDAARLERPSRAPRPGAVVARAGQLDVDPARHRP